MSATSVSDRPARLFAAALALAACDGAAPLPRTPGDAATPGNAAVRFELPPGALPAPLQVPWPSDLYRTDADGTLADTLADWTLAGVRRSSATFRDGYGAMDGFGRTTGAMFSIEGAELDPASLPADGARSLAPGASVAIVDLARDPDSPGTGDPRVPCRAGWTPAFRVLTVLPDAAALEPAHRYAVVVTTAVRTTAGGYLRAAPGFEAIRDAARGAGPRATPAGALYGDASDRAAALLNVPRAAIAGLAVFTTQGTGRLRAARDALAAGRYGPPPRLLMEAPADRSYVPVRFGADRHEGWTATLDELAGAPRRSRDGTTDLPGWASPRHDPADAQGLAHDAIGVLATGFYVSPEFRRPYQVGQTAATTGTIAFGADGAPVAQDPGKVIPVTLVLPREAPPPEGWPVVLVLARTNQRRSRTCALGNELARAGIALAIIEPVETGLRARGFGQDRGTRAPGTYQGPDGFEDGVDPEDLTAAGGGTNVLAIRDNFRQTALDLVQLRRLVASAGALEPFAAQYGGRAPRLDPARVGFLGAVESAALGLFFADLEPDVRALALVGLMDSALLDFVPESYQSFTVTRALLGVIYGITAPPETPYHPVLSLWQALLDDSDASLVARAVARPPPSSGRRAPDVFLVSADRDAITPNVTTERAARLMGLALVGAHRAVPGLRAVPAPWRGDDGGATQGLAVLTPAWGLGMLVDRWGENVFRPPFPRSGLDRFPQTCRARVRQPILALHRSLARFFNTSWAGRAEIALDGLEPLVDYDDDGWTDDEEAAAGTDACDTDSHPPGPAPHARDVGF